VKLLMENWRRYLNEVTFSDAKEILDSKRTLKIIKAYRYDKEKESEARGAIYGGPLVDTQHRNFKNYLLDMVPHDLTDNQKGTSVLWLLKMARKDPEVAADLINGRVIVGPRRSLETFFHHQRFMPNQDLMQIKTLSDLVIMAYDAKEEIEKAQEKKNYLDAEQGTEVFRDDDEWTIAALHNKGAACELGKNTDWCTAAPGLDYFENYYKEDDPLFYFQNKKNMNKFQFHYGSAQFMNSRDERVNKESFEVLHSLLVETEAWNKYEILRIFELKRMVQLRRIAKRGEPVLIDEMRKILNSLKDPYTMASELTEMATSSYNNIPTYIVRWLSGEEFYKYPDVARKIVKYHEVVPTDILEDLAENNPYGALRKMAREVIEKRRSDSDAGNRET